MKGSEVREILRKNGFALNDIAIAMGETPQNLQSMLRATDIKTGVLERIANAINKNLYFFFNTEELPSPSARQTELDFSVLLESNKNMSESVRMLAENNTKVMFELMQLIHDFKEVMGKLDMGAGGAGGVASGRKVG